ncbi:hypothetical protein MEN41_09355 [Dolichospermum sp. ST_con]|jgi:hypothetical protein|nr:hypothetical protein [Dolichospermum sp. ST_con]
MINKNIIIAALARDCEDSLRTNIPLIEELRSQFSWSQIVVVENDSKDGTKGLLNDWKINFNHVTIISKDFGTKTIPDKSDLIINPYTTYQRIDKMVSYRNLYLEHINKVEHPIDLVIIIDIDVIEISLTGLINAINSFEEKTGAIFSNGVSVMKTPFGLSEIYYDIFAVWEYPLLHEFSYSAGSLAKTFKSINRNIKKSPLYSVISAFGGVGIYNYAAIKDLRYKTVLNPVDKQEAICEHIPFNHEIIKRGYKNYIHRDLQVIYQRHNWILILKLLLSERIFNLLHPIILKLKK